MAYKQEVEIVEGRLQQQKGQQKTFLFKERNKRVTRGLLAWTGAAADLVNST